MHWTPPSAGFDPTLDRLGFVSSTRDDEGELITAEASSCRSLVNRRAAGASRLFPNTRGGHDTLISFHFVYVPSTEKTWNLCWIFMHNWRAFALQHENLIHPAGQASIESMWAAILELHYIPSVWSWKRRTWRGKGNDKSIANTAVINAVVVAVLFFWKAWRKVRLRSWLPRNLIWKDRWEWQHKLWLRVCGEPPRMASVQLCRWLLHRALIQQSLSMAPVHQSVPRTSPVTPLAKSLSSEGAARGRCSPIVDDSICWWQNERAENWPWQAPPAVISLSTNLTLSEYPCCLWCSEEVCSYSHSVDIRQLRQNVPSQENRAKK